MSLSPVNQTDLQDKDEDTIRISGTSILDSDRRQELLEQRISILNKKLQRQREKLCNNDGESGESAQEVIVGEKRKSLDKGPVCQKISKITMPEPEFLVGKRVEHTFFVSEKNNSQNENDVNKTTKRRKKCFILE